MADDKKKKVVLTRNILINGEHTPLGTELTVEKRFYDWLLGNGKGAAPNSDEAKAAKAAAKAAAEAEKEAEKAAA